MERQAKCGKGLRGSAATGGRYDGSPGRATVKHPRSPEIGTKPDFTTGAKTGAKTATTKTQRKNYTFDRWPSASERRRLLPLQSSRRILITNSDDYNHDTWPKGREFSVLRNPCNLRRMLYFGFSDAVAVDPENGPQLSVILSDHVNTPRQKISNNPVDSASTCTAVTRSLGHSLTIDQTLSPGSWRLSRLTIVHSLENG